MRVSGVAMVLAALVVSGGAGMRAEAEPAVGGGEIEGLERWLDGTNDLT